MGVPGVQHWGQNLILENPKIAPDFFGLIRAWHEKGKNGNNWENLRLALVYSTDVYIQLKIDRSPFNVGQAIELPEFNYEQVQELVNRYSLNWNKEQVEQLMSLIGGHPHLVQKTLSYIKNHSGIELKKIFETAATASGIYYDHLWELWLNLQEEPELIEAMKKIVMASKPVRLEQKQVRQLNRMGLIRLLGNDVEARCELYRSYFGNCLINN